MQVRDVGAESGIPFPVFALHQPVLGNRSRFERGVISPGKHQSRYKPNTQTACGKGMLSATLVAADCLLIVGNRIQPPFVRRKAVSHHPPGLQQEIVFRGFLRQSQRLFSKANARTGLRAPWLTGIQLRAAYFVPELLKRLFQCVSLFGLHRSSILRNFSRQRARVGPMLATGMPKRFEISTYVGSVASKYRSRMRPSQRSGSSATARSSKNSFSTASTWGSASEM